jgi:transcription initiation factor TFIIH subunit 1
VDPRPQAVEGGEVKIVITPQLVHDIFDEYPVVAKAYDENVPSKVPISRFLRCTASYILYGSCLKPNFGNDIFSQSFSILIEPPSVPPRPSMSLKMTRSSTSIWKSQMTVRSLYSGATRPTNLCPTELEPRRLRDDEVDMFIDLEATREDHEEV